MLMTKHFGQSFRVKAEDGRRARGADVSALDASRNKKGLLLHQRCAGGDLKPADALIVTSHSKLVAGEQAS